MWLARTVAMNAQGEEVSLDEVFADMCAKVGGELAQASSVTALKKPPAGVHGHWGRQGWRTDARQWIYIQ